jgi:hypothetical protein
MTVINVNMPKKRKIITECAPYALTLYPGYGEVPDGCLGVTNISWIFACGALVKHPSVKIMVSNQEH